MRPKRGKLGVIESILKSLVESSELKTNIAYKSKIDSRTISQYLLLLVQLHLIAPASSGKYKISKKGHVFLKQYAKLKKYDIM